MSTSIHETYATTKRYYLEFFSVVYNQTISFPGMLTNFQNSFKPEWSKESVFGRQDPILTFKNTSREISVSFTVAADSESTAKRNIRSLNTLIKFLYPAFRSGDTSNSISASPLLKIKFANLIYDAHVGNSAGNAQSSGLICGITDFDHKFDFDGKTSWVDYVDNVFPMSFEISFTAAVQHSHPLGRIDGGNFAGAEPTPMPFPYGLGGSGRSVPEAIAPSTAPGRDAPTSTSPGDENTADPDSLTLLFADGSPVRTPYRPDRQPGWGVWEDTSLVTDFDGS